MYRFRQASIMFNTTHSTGKVERGFFYFISIRVSSKVSKNVWYGISQEKIGKLSLFFFELIEREKYSVISEPV